MHDLGENIDEHELQEMIEKADKDNDGLVSEDEFYNVMTHKHMWSWWSCISMKIQSMQ